MLPGASLETGAVVVEVVPLGDFADWLVVASGVVGVVV